MPKFILRYRSTTIAVATVTKKKPQQLHSKDFISPAEFLSSVFLDIFLFFPYFPLQEGNSFLCLLLLLGEKDESHWPDVSGMMNLQFTVLVCWGHLWRSWIGISTGTLHLPKVTSETLLAIEKKWVGGELLLQAMSNMFLLLWLNYIAMVLPFLQKSRLEMSQGREISRKPFKIKGLANVLKNTNIGYG